jgi:hypothetical protein
MSLDNKSCWFRSQREEYEPVGPFLLEQYQARPHRCCKVRLRPHSLRLCVLSQTYAKWAESTSYDTHGTEHNAFSLENASLTALLTGAFNWLSSTCVRILGCHGHHAYRQNFGSTSPSRLNSRPLLPFRRRQYRLLLGSRSHN